MVVRVRQGLDTRAEQFRTDTVFRDDIGQTLDGLSFPSMLKRSFMGIFNKQASSRTESGIILRN